MKGLQLHKHPEYRLLKQNDAVSFFHMQMPRWLFCDPKYASLSLESKVAYTFLLNRFQLSKMNGWINSDGEVFIIFPREKLAEEMGISYRKAIACFKELLSANLIWEHRIGRGNANHIYMAAVELSNENANKHTSAPFSPRSAESAGLDADFDSGQDSQHSGSDAAAQIQEVPNPHVMKCKNSRSGSAETAFAEVPILHPSNKEYIKKDKSNIEKVSQSCPTRARGSTQGDRQTDTDLEAEILGDIMDSCEFEVLPDDDAGVFRNAITRLFYSDSFKIGNAVLPCQVIRSHLHHLDGTVLLDTREKLRQNLSKQVKNSTAYVMAALLNNIWECKSDLMVDPYLNSLGVHGAAG